MTDMEKYGFMWAVWGLGVGFGIGVLFIYLTMIL